MDSDGDKQKNIGNDLPNDSDLSEPSRVRYFGLPLDAVNQRLLDYNVRSLYICVPIIYIIFCIL